LAIFACSGSLAAAVDELDRRPGLARHPAVAPASERDDDRVEVPALFRQGILEARGALLVADAFENSVSHERPQAVGETVTRRAEVSLEVFEATNTEKRVA
jgi:hypothetical protein